MAQTLLSFPLAILGAYIVATQCVCVDSMGFLTDPVFRWCCVFARYKIKTRRVFEFALYVPSTLFHAFLYELQLVTLATETEILTYTCLSLLKRNWRSC